MRNKLAIGLVIIVGGFIGSMAYKVWTLGGDPDDYNIMCLGGHSYWRANFATKGFLAVKLNDDGTPVSCINGN